MICNVVIMTFYFVAVWVLANIIAAAFDVVS